MRLTGMDPDRLDEEKRRGLTIELGYAWCTLPSGREVGFVDVPGHERFVRTMLAGVGPVRLVLFVVAADEGWKPQSEEHLEIVDVLGAHGAVIALTKRDLVDAESLERAEPRSAERVRGTALEGAPIVACSSATGEGFDELVAALDAMLAGAPEPEREGRPRLHVDRVFTIKGSGTVVTGTLTGGPLAVGDGGRAPAVRDRARGSAGSRRTTGTSRPRRRSRGSRRTSPPNRARASRGARSLPRPACGPPRPSSRRASNRCDRSTVRSRRAARSSSTRARPNATRGSASTTSKQVPADGAFVRITLSEPLVLDVGRPVRPARVGTSRDDRRRGRPRYRAAAPRGPGADATSRSARAGASRAELPALLVAERVPCRSTTSGRSWVSRRRRSTARSGSAGGGSLGRRSTRSARRSRRRLAAFHAEEPAAAGEDVATVRRSVADAFARIGGAARSRTSPTPRSIGSRPRGRSCGRAPRFGSRRIAPGRGDEIAALVDVVRSAEPTPPTIAELRASGVAAGVLDAACARAPSSGSRRTSS